MPCRNIIGMGQFEDNNPPPCCLYLHGGVKGGAGGDGGDGGRGEGEGGEGGGTGGGSCAPHQPLGKHIWLSSWHRPLPTTPEPQGPATGNCAVKRPMARRVVFNLQGGWWGVLGGWNGWAARCTHPRRGGGGAEGDHAPTTSSPEGKGGCAGVTPATNLTSRGERGDAGGGH